MSFSNYSTLIYLLPGVLVIVAGLILLRLDRRQELKYDSEVEGKVTDHKWTEPDNSQQEYPTAVVTYFVKGIRYNVKQTFYRYRVNMRKPAPQNWTVDDKYRIWHNSLAVCNNVEIDPFETFFPLGTKMTVHYSSENPKDAYCGSSGDYRNYYRIITFVGIGVLILGVIFVIIFW